MPHLQTDYCVHGRAGTGKGVLNRTIKSLIGNQNMIAINLKDLLNPFARQSLVHASVLVLNEVDKIDSFSRNIIQALLGRDELNDQIKFVPGIFSFQFRGTVIISTTTDPAVLFANSTALMDRFILITHAPRVSQANPFFERILLTGSIRIVHWSLATPRSYFEPLVRTGTMNQSLIDDTHHLDRFVLEHIGYQLNNVVPVKPIHDHYMHVCSEEVSLYEECGFAKRIINSIKSATRCRDVAEVRQRNKDKRRTVALKNVCLIKENNNQCVPFEKSDFVSQTPHKEKSENESWWQQDPFAIDPTHITYTIAERWRAEVGSSLNMQALPEVIEDNSDLLDKLISEEDNIVPPLLEEVVPTNDLYDVSWLPCPLEALLWAHLETF